jgi:NhaP-type Na+/H+ or K+/H+ antiporter
MSETLLLQLVAVITLGIAAQWLAWRLKWPSILLLLLFGCAAGAGAQWIFDERFIQPDVLMGDLLMPFVSVTVALILFEGGLSLKRSELREVGGAVRNFMILAGVYLLQFEFALALLLGAIFVVTGPTVIGPLLRQVRPTGQVGPALKWEGIVNDPLGAILAVLVYEVVAPGNYDTATVVLGTLARCTAIGVIGGVLGAAMLIIPLRRYWIPDFLHNPAALTVVVLVFSISNLLQHESGLLTVTIMGIVMANQRWANVQHIVEFKEDLRTLLLSILFILLSARITVEQLHQIDWHALAFLAALIIVIRPACVALSMLGTKVKRNERIFMMLIAPRGIVAAAVSAVFAERLAGQFPQAQAMVPVTFVVIVGTIAFSGLIAGPAAKRLKLVTANPQGLLFLGAHGWARKIALALHEQKIPVVMVDTNRANIRASRLEGIPARHGNILDDSVLESIDLSGIRRFVALTPNDEANALACMHCAELFETQELYQVPPAKRSGKDKDEKPASQSHLRGRYVFKPDVTWWDINARFLAGAVVKTTPLSDTFDRAAFDTKYGDAALPLFLLSSEGRLTLITATDPPKAEPGDRIIYLLDREANERVRRDRQSEDEQHRRANHSPQDG